MDLAVEGAEVEHRLVVAVLLEVRLLGDERLERLHDALLDQDALAIQSLEGNVRQALGDRFLQRLLRAVLVGLVRLAGMRTLCS